MKDNLNYQDSQRIWYDKLGRLNENAVVELLLTTAPTKGYVRYAMLEIDRLRNELLAKKSMLFPHTAEAPEFLQGFNPWEEFQKQKKDLIIQIQSLFPEGVISEDDAQFLLETQGWFADLALNKAGL